MKKALTSIFVLLFLLAACSPQAAATQPPVDVGEAATQPAESNTAAQDAAVSTLAKNLGLDAGEIKVISSEAVEWPDACLGVTKEGVACAQVVTTGNRWNIIPIRMAVWPSRPRWH